MKRASVFVRVCSDDDADCFVYIERSDGKKSTIVCDTLSLAEALGRAREVAGVLGCAVVNEVKVHKDCPCCRCKPE